MSLSKQFLVLTVLALFARIAQCQIDPVMKQQIDNLIENVYLPENTAPALALSIVKDGEVLYNAGYGIRNLQNNWMANNDTLFFIGSNSKSFTATLVVKTLHEHFPELGELALDTPIAELIPGYNFTLGDRYRSEQTTFRDILAHRTGTLPEGVGTFFGAIDNVPELVYRQRYAPQVFSFRTGDFLYDNGNLAMAGELASEISGVPYEQMLDDLFRQIGMEATTYIKADDDHDSMTNRAAGYFKLNGNLVKYNSELYKRTIPMQAAGGIISSANDMAKYMLFHLNSGRVGNVQIIPEDVMKWMGKSSNALPSVWKTNPEDRISTDIAYSLGLFLSSYDGWQILGHGGYLTPFNSQLTLYPVLNLGIFSNTNGPGRLLPNFSHKLLHEDIFDIIYGLDKEPRTRTVTTNMNYPAPIFTHLQKSFAYKSPNVPFQNADVVGQYGNGQSGELEITEKLNATGSLELYMSYGQWGQAWVRPREGVNNDFVLHWDSDIIQEFYSTGADVEISVLYDDIDKTITFFENGFPTAVYNKDQDLDDLPAQPWSPDSCSPEK